MSNRIERRVFKFELRASKAGNKTKLSGYAAVFNSDSEDLGGFVEQIAPGAFSQVLASSTLDCRCLLNHDPSLILGRTTSGTLRLHQDSQGLFYECDVPDTGAGRDVLVSAERGDINQSSFGFRVADDDGAEQWYDKNGREVSPWSYEGVRRIVRKVSELFDVSPVTYPAYTASSVEARSRFLFPEGRPQRSTGNAEDARRDGQKLIFSERRRKDALRDVAQRQIDRIRQQL